jgi:hypothetical protein
VSDAWRAAWDHVGRTLGLRFAFGGALLVSAELEGVVEGVAVRASLHTSLAAGVDPGHLIGTSVHAAVPPHPPSLRLSVARGYIYPIGRPFFQDLRVGDPRFDDTFIVKGAPDELVRLWLAPPVREAMFGAVDWQFGLEPERAWATLGRIESSAPILVSALTAVARLARRSHDLADERSKVAGGLGGSAPDTPWDGEPGHPIRLDREGTPIAIEHLHGKLGNRWRAPKLLHTKITAPRSEGATHRFRLVRRRLARHFGGRGSAVDVPDEGLAEKYLAHAEDRGRFRAHLTPELRRLVARTLPDAILVDDQVSLWLLGLQLAAPMLRPYVELAAALGPEELPRRAGPYR